MQLVWEEVVGPHLAAEARPVRESGGELLVSCASATWAQELDLLQGDLLERLRGRLGEAAPGRIRFVTGGPG